MVTRKEILEDIRANNIRLSVTVYEGSRGNSRDATDEEIESMTYWELWREWTQAHTLNIVAGIVRP